MRIKMKYPLTKEELLLLEELKTYEVAQNVERYYKTEVKNNELENYEIIKAKLIRNIILGRKGDIINSRGISYYGNLQIIYNIKEKAIVYLNNCKGNFKLYIDQDKKDWLEINLGLKEENNVNYSIGFINKIKSYFHTNYLKGGEKSWVK